MNRWLSQRLAAHSVTQQIEASVRADAAAAAVDRVFRDHWRNLLRDLNTRVIVQAQAAAHQALVGSFPLAVSTVRGILDRHTRWSWATGQGHARSTLPLAYLEAGAKLRLGVTESLLEAPYAPSVSDITDPKPDSGAIELALHGLGFPIRPGDIRFTMRSRYTEPAASPLTPEAKRAAFLDLLFPPPSQGVIDSILYATVQGQTWEQRLAGATRTSATPQQLAHVVGQGVAQGKTVQEIAKALLPVVDGVRSTARRIARTESLRVIQEASFQSWQGMKELIVGYQIKAVLDQVTRPDHAKRNGTIYYTDPKNGQKGMSECPHPPLEADGSIAWNCRCGLAKVMAPLPHLQTVEFKTAAGKAIGDPQTYDQWFAGASEQHRRTAVGSRRYDAARELLGRTPDWPAFVDPEDGGLLTLGQIKAETASDRAARIGAVRSAMGERRDLLRKVLTMRAV